MNMRSLDRLVTGIDNAANRIFCETVFGHSRLSEAAWREDPARIACLRGDTAAKAGGESGLGSLHQRTRVPGTNHRTRGVPNPTKRDRACFVLAPTDGQGTTGGVA